MNRKIGGFLVFFAAAFFAISLTLLASRPSTAATIEDDCVGNFGTWSGPSSDDGTCTYAANSNYAISHCGADSIYTETFDSSTETTTTACTAVAPTSTQSTSGYAGGCRREVRGPLPHPVKISLCHGKNGTVIFPTGACELKCTISSGIPAAAARKLPVDAEATLYVRVVNSGGVPGNDSYTVCFTLTGLDLNPPVVFRFFNGKWELAAIGNSENAFICVVGAGDGAYSLSEPPKGG